MPFREGRPFHYSGASWNPGKSNSWTLAYAGVTDLISASLKSERPGPQRRILWPDKGGGAYACASANRWIRDKTSRMASRGFSVIVGLQIEPALRFSAEERRQTQGRICSDAAQTMHNLIDAAGRNLDGLACGYIIVIQRYIWRRDPESNRGTRLCRPFGFGLCLALRKIATDG